MKIFFKCVFAFLLCGVLCCGMCKTTKVSYAEKLVADDIESTAKAYVLVEENSNTVLYGKNENERLPMASITKVQTLNLVFDAIEKGELGLDDDVVISEHAAKQKGSQAFLDEGKVYKVKDLIKTVIINSANDSAVALAEKVCGTEQKFVEKMNEKAKQMGLVDTHFENATGLPVINHYSTATEIAKMFEKLVKNDVYLKYAKIWMDCLVHPSGRKTELVNTNRLLKTMTDCVAGKTGYTDEAKHCLVAKCNRNGMSLVCCVLGVDNSKQRFENVKTLFNLGYANFEVKKLVCAGDVFGSVDVKKGKMKKVDAVAETDFEFVCAKGDGAKLNYQVELFEEVYAPIKQNDLVGFLKIKDENDNEICKIQLVSSEDVEKNDVKGIFGRIKKMW